MAYQDELRNPHAHPNPDRPLAYDTRPRGGSGAYSLVLGGIVLLIILGVLGLSFADGDGGDPAAQPQPAAIEQAAPAPAADPAAGAAPAPLAPGE